MFSGILRSKDTEETSVGSKVESCSEINNLVAITLLAEERESCS